MQKNETDFFKYQRYYYSNTLTDFYNSVKVNPEPSSMVNLLQLQWQS